jgi:hypothetical protein
MSTDEALKVGAVDLTPIYVCWILDREDRADL